MSFRATLEALSVLDSANVDGKQVAQVLDSFGVKNVEPSIIHGDKGRTDFIKAVIPDLAERRMAEMRPRWV